MGESGGSGDDVVYVGSIEEVLKYKGYKGDPGNAGRFGIDGDRGYTGSYGPKGERGDKGLSGVFGFRGQSGMPGYSPRGFQGDRGAFLNLYVLKLSIILSIFKVTMVKEDVVATLAKQAFQALKV